MPDLSVNTGIYNNLPKPGGAIGNMSLSDLINTAQGLGNYQSQRAMSDAISQTTGPDGTPDPAAAAKVWAADPRATMKTPGQAQAFTQASGAAFDLRKNQFTAAASMLGSLVSDPDLNIDKVNRIMPAVTSLLGPSSAGLIAPIIGGDKSPEGLRAQLTPILNSVNANAGLPTQEGISATGATAQIPKGSALYSQQPGVIQTGLPTGATSALDAAAKESTALRTGAPQRVTSLNQLGELYNLSQNATTAKTGDAEIALNNFANRLGINVRTLDDPSVAASEQFKKLTSMFQANMATSTHATDAFLHNAYSSNPNLEMSKLGREGVIHWMMGNVDVENKIAGDWENWLSAHPGQDNQYLKWLNSAKMPDGSVGFNVKSIDPRVFQFSRMSQPEQQSFYGMMTPAQKKSFVSNLQDYESKGWVGSNAAQ